jgi:hypothetical protein
MSTISNDQIRTYIRSALPKNIYNQLVEDDKIGQFMTQTTKLIQDYTKSKIPKPVYPPAFGSYFPDTQGDSKVSALLGYQTKLMKFIKEELNNTKAIKAGGKRTRKGKAKRSTKKRSTRRH